MKRRDEDLRPDETLEDEEGIPPIGIAQSSRPHGLGPDSAGQSGDDQGLSDFEGGSESVEELVAEGQYFEAGVVSGIENAPDADVSEVRTRQVPEDDVPDEYLTNDSRDSDKS